MCREILFLCATHSFFSRSGCHDKVSDPKSALVDKAFHQRDFLILGTSQFLLNAEIYNRPINTNIQLIYPLYKVAR
ncbi:hypothetical protein L596_000308 [Steinernema carpocapsae]|uniref:Uncharacterized protein n=1 Tax=Steinernema carpocapsae TaxID=34508 RepID=A0A4U8ULZ5_STECR|nr:hypothetical protein L596_000308 [Steinernema carpocapsae]